MNPSLPNDHSCVSGVYHLQLRPNGQTTAQTHPAQNEQQKKGLQKACHSRVSGVHHLQLRPHLVDLQHVAVGDAQLAVNHDLRIAKQEIIGMHEEGAAG